MFCFSLLLLMTMMGAAYLYAPSPADAQSKQATSAAGSTQQPATEIRGTWSGTFFSKHSNVAPFTMTVVINPDSPRTPHRQLHPQLGLPERRAT